MRHPVEPQVGYSGIARHGARVFQTDAWLAKRESQTPAAFRSPLQLHSKVYDSRWIARRSLVTITPAAPGPNQLETSFEVTPKNRAYPVERMTGL